MLSMVCALGIEYEPPASQVDGRLQTLATVIGVDECHDPTPRSTNGYLGQHCAQNGPMREMVRWSTTEVILCSYPISLLPRE